MPIQGSAIAIVGGIITWVFIAEMDRDLERRGARFRRYLEENGFGVIGLGGDSLAEQTKSRTFKLDG